MIDRPEGEVRGANLLTLRPGWAWVAVVAPMPVFFAAGGWANARSTPRAAVARLRPLMGIAVVLVLAWSAAVVTAVAVTGEPGVVGDGARVATRPLWFVAAYAPFAALGGRISTVATARPVLAPLACLAALVGCDLARFAGGAPAWIGWPCFYLAWGLPWLLGASWRAASERAGFRERRVGVVLACSAGAVAWALVRFAGYAPALIDTSSSARSNTTPPTLYTAVVGVAQVGVLLVAAGVLDRIGRRWPALWSRAGEAAIGVYLWHLSALVLCAGVIAAGLPVPDRLTTLWWWTRPVWWTAVLALTAGLVAATAGARHRVTRRTPALGARRLVPPTAGIVLTTAAGAYVGMRGPASAGQAVVSSVLVVGAAVALARAAPQRSRSTSRNDSRYGNAI